MHVLYLTHDLADPTTAKRVRMLVTGGATVHVAGFSRTIPDMEIAGCHVTDLGRTFNGRFVQRVGAVLRTLVTLRTHRGLFTAADVIIARNLETLGLAVRGRAIAGTKAPIAYEVLDIHRLLLRNDPIGSILRKLEHWLASHTALIITSSPAFIREYFQSRNPITIPTLLLENKVFTSDSIHPSPRPAGPPWRISWFGALRCRKSLDILCGVARANPGLVEIIIRGRPAYDQLPNFDEQVRSAHGVKFLGPYRTEELASIYHEVHFSWAIDMFEEDLNSSWLLANRIYEGSLYGAVPLAAENVETSRFLTNLGIGHTLGKPKAETFTQFLKTLTTESYQAMATAVANIPASTWRCNAQDCVSLVTHLAALQAPVSMPAAINLSEPQDETPALTIIPCLNEAPNLEALVKYLLIESSTTPMDIIIADGGSTDGTVEIAQRLTTIHPQVKYLHNPKRIQSAAINLAVATFGEGHRYLIRIDAHAHYPRGFCATLVNEAKLSGADSVVVSMNTIGNPGFQEAVAAAQNSKLGNGGSSHRAGQRKGKWVDHGHHALMRIAAYQAVGGYDETFTHNEDAELDTRLRQAGNRIWLTAATTLDYFPRATPSALFKQYRNYGAGRLRTLLKHREKPKLRQLLPIAVAPAAALALLSPILTIAALPFIAYGGLCIAYGTLIAWRAKRPELIMSGPAAMVMHGGWSLGFWQGVWKHVTKASA
ncbi:MAG: glycosyltransferase [Rickettsiales bacterium]